MGRLDPDCLDPFGSAGGGNQTPPSVAAARLRELAWAAAPRSVGGNDGGSFLFAPAGVGTAGGLKSIGGVLGITATDSPLLCAAEEGRAAAVAGGTLLTSSAGGGGRRRSVVSFAPE